MLSPVEVDVVCVVHEVLMALQVQKLAHQSLIAGRDERFTYSL